MNKKLMLYMLATLIFSLSVIVTLFIFIVNYENMENIKKNLELNNKTIINMINSNEISDIPAFINKSFKKSKIRVTYIDKDGKVLVDSMIPYENIGNHNNRDEVIKARKDGDGYNVRWSSSIKSNSIYFATKLADNSVVRSSIKIETVSIFENKYLKYYGFIILLAFGMSFIFSSKLSFLIVKPIKDLEFITSRIAKGELDRRVNIYSNDEIGQLGITFNNMAEKLQSNMNDALDKQNKLEAIMKSMDSGVIAIDKKFKVIMINPYAKKIFGVKGDIIGKNLMDSIRDFELENIFKENIDDYREIKIIWPKERELRIKTADINNGYELIGKVAVVQDVTDMKKLENMRSQFVANVSHELKTPLTSIKGFAETLKYVNDDSSRDKFLNIINDEAERLTRLINDILTLSHIENNKDDKIETIDVNEVIKDVYYLMKNTAEKKEINLEIKGEKVPDLLGNKDKFKQMLINIVDNGIKYTEKGGSVTVCKDLKDNKCILWVKDTGVGIPKNDIPRLFERFYRVDKARSRAQGGTGLGLAIVKHIVLAFNGTIEVESEEGKGSKFKIALPIKK